MTRLVCEGWWEQAGYGRQPMRQLEIRFDGRQLQGSGTDIIGPFELSGVCQQDRVAIVKQYLGRHFVEYYGTTDGEGTFQGHWGWGGLLGGKWLIRISRISAAADQEVCDITESLAERNKLAGQASSSS